MDNHIKRVKVGWTGEPSTWMTDGEQHRWPSVYENGIGSHHFRRTGTRDDVTKALKNMLQMGVEMGRICAPSLSVRYCAVGPTDDPIIVSYSSGPWFDRGIVSMEMYSRPWYATEPIEDRVEGGRRARARAQTVAQALDKALKGDFGVDDASRLNEALNPVEAPRPGTPSPSM